MTDLAVTRPLHDKDMVMDFSLNPSADKFTFQFFSDGAVKWRVPGMGAEQMSL